MSEIKKVIVLNGEIINVGEWDYQITIDESGNEIIGNPLPEGATEEEREMFFSEEHGWREVGWKPPITKEEQIEQLKQENEILKYTLESILTDVLPSIFE